MMVHGSTFSGIGAPEIAAEMLGWENAFHCEINPFGRQVLDYYFPNSDSYEDITKTDFSKWRGKIDVLTGGFPCQPFSYAGKRRGSEDDRFLWPYMLDCIKQIRPTWFIGENVAGITTMVLPCEAVKVGSEASIFEQTDYMERNERYVIEEICQQLEDIGYSVQPLLIPACAVGAPHKRDRVFIVARRVNQGEDVLQSKRTISDTSDSRAEGMRQGRQDEIHRPQSIADTDCDGGLQVHEHMEPEQPDGAIAFGNGWEWNTPSPRWDFSADGQWLPTQSPVHRGNDGIPIRLDNLTIPFPKWRNESIKAYGNAIVVQVMYEIFRAINDMS